jgi:pyruvate kinase
VLDGLDQYCDYPYLVEDVSVGQVVRIESGIFDVLVKDKNNECLMVEALNDVTIKQRRHVNLPGTTIKLPGLIDQDIENVLFCIKHNFDFIAMSFVRSAEHIKELRDLLAKNDAAHI